MIYRGFSPVAAAILVVIASTLVTMYLVAGVSVKATAAVIGTVMGVLVAGILAFLFGKLCHVTGYNVSDIENLIYVQEQVGIEVGELLFAGILIAALGAVMDVSMSISSTLQEIHDKNPGLTGRQLFHSGMTVGKDMMGTMSIILMRCLPEVLSIHWFCFMRMPILIPRSSTCMISPLKSCRVYPPAWESC